MNTCLIENCTRPVLNRGLCSPCYIRLRSNGTVEEFALPSKNNDTVWHRMSNVDEEIRIGDCSVCGPSTNCYKGKRDTKWRCRNKKRETERKADNPRRTYKYGDGEKIPKETYSAARERLQKEQNGKCAICGTASAKLSLDHCHTTGKIRGLLCAACNTGIGMLRDSTVNLSAAIDYLNR